MEIEFPVTRKPRVVPRASSGKSTTIGHSSGKDYAKYQRSLLVPANMFNNTSSPGLFSAQLLVSQYICLIERKVSSMSKEKTLPISLVSRKILDFHLTKILSALTSTCEFLLPSVIRILNEWFHADNQTSSSHGTSHRDQNSSIRSQNKKKIKEFVYCATLTQILETLRFHPSLNISEVEDYAFNTLVPSGSQSESVGYIKEISDMCLKLIGVIADNRFCHIGRRFVSELETCFKEESSPSSTHRICAVLKGMSQLNIKVTPIEDLKVCFTFLNDLATMLIDAKDKEVRQRAAHLFSTMLVPFVNVCRSEVNIPCVRALVNRLYNPTFEACVKGKEKTTYYTLLTCLLCMSRRNFFLNNWHKLLTMCLQNLKSSDTRLSKTCLECVSRLVWFVAVRLRIAANSNVIQHLNCVVNSILPRGSKIIVPKDCDLYMFVQIICYLSRGQRDIIITEVIGDLLSFGHSRSYVPSERIIIGVQSYLLEVLLSGNSNECIDISPFSTSDLERQLIASIANVTNYEKLNTFVHYKAFVRSVDQTLRNLDTLWGKSLLIGNGEKEIESVSSSTEMKNKLRLLQLCVLVTPLCITDFSSVSETAEFLIRLTIHQNTEIASQASKSLKIILTEQTNLAVYIFSGYMSFLARGICDQQKFQAGLASQLHISIAIYLRDLIVTWGSALVYSQNRAFKSVQDITRALEFLDAMSLTLIFAIEHQLRSIGLEIMESVVQISATVDQSLPTTDGEAFCYRPVLYLLNDRAKQLNHSEQEILLITGKRNLKNVDVHLLLSQSSDAAFQSDDHDNEDCITKTLRYLLDYRVVREMTHVQKYVWHFAFKKCSQMLPLFDSSSSGEGRSSLLFRNFDYLRKASERECNHLQFRNYLILACCFAPSKTQSKSYKSREDNYFGSHSSNFAALLKLVLPLLRSETVQTQCILCAGISSTHPDAFDDLICEMSPYIRDLLEQKQERFRRSKKREHSKLTLIKIFQRIAMSQAFGARFESGLNCQRNIALFHEHVRLICVHFEQDADKDSEISIQIRISFCQFIRTFITQIPFEHRSSLITRDIKLSLLGLLDKWSGCLSIFRQETIVHPDISGVSSLNRHAFRASGSLLCAGPMDTDDKMVLGKNETSNDNSNITFVTRSSQLVSAVYRAPGRIIMHVAPSMKKPRPLIGEHDQLYNEHDRLFAWLERMVCTEQEGETAIQTLTELLILNGEGMDMLECVLNMFYSLSSTCTDAPRRCFDAITNVFLTHNSDYPCDIPSLLTIAMTCLSNPTLHERALRLTIALSQEHLQSSLFSISPKSVLCKSHIISNNPGADEVRSTLLDLFKQSTLSWHDSDLIISHLATCCPEMTMPIFSEVCERSVGVAQILRPALLKAIIPWLRNLQLDTGILTESKELSDATQYSNCNLSRNATDLCLNNLVYLTKLFGDSDHSTLELVWNALLHNRQKHNLEVIVRYFFVLVSVGNQELLSSVFLQKLFLPQSKFSLSKVQWGISFLSKSNHYDQLFLIIFEHLSDDTCLLSTYTRCGNQPFYCLKQQCSPLDDTSRSTNKADTSMDSSVTDTCDLKLPMPSYGGYFAPLSTYFVEASNIVNGLPLTSGQISIIMMNTYLRNCVNLFDTAWMQKISTIIHYTVCNMCQHAHISEPCVQLLLTLIYKINVACGNDKLSEQVFITAISDDVPEQLDGADVLSLKNFTSFAKDRLTFDSVEYFDRLVLSILDLLPRSIGKDLIRKAGSENHNSSSVMDNLALQWQQTALDTALNSNSFVQESFQIVRAIPNVLNLDTIIQLTSKLVELVLMGESESDFPSVNIKNNSETAQNIACDNKTVVADQIIKTLLSNLTYHLDLYEERRMNKYDPLKSYANDISRIATSSLSPNIIRSARFPCHTIGYCASRASNRASILNYNNSFASSHEPLMWPYNSAQNPAYRLGSNQLDCYFGQSSYKTSTILPLPHACDPSELLSITEVVYFPDQEKIFQNSADEMFLRDVITTIEDIADRVTEKTECADQIEQKVIDDAQSFTSNNRVSYHATGSRDPLTSTISYCSYSKSRSRSMDWFTSRMADRQHLSRYNESNSGYDEDAIVSIMFCLALCLLESSEITYFKAGSNILKIVLGKLNAHTVMELEAVLKRFEWQHHENVFRKITENPFFYQHYDACVDVLGTLCVNAYSLLASSADDALSFVILAALPYLMNNFDDNDKPNNGNENSIASTLTRNLNSLCTRQCSANLRDSIQPILEYSGSSNSKGFKNTDQWAKCILKNIVPRLHKLTIRWISFYVKMIDHGSPVYQKFILLIIFYIVYYYTSQTCDNYVQINEILLPCLVRYLHGANCNLALMSINYLIAKSSSLAAPGELFISSKCSNKIVTSHMSQVSFVDECPSKSLPGRTLSFEVDVENLLSAMRNSVATHADQEGTLIKTTQRRRRHTNRRPTIPDMCKKPMSTTKKNSMRRRILPMLMLFSRSSKMPDLDLCKEDSPPVGYEDPNSDEQASLTFGSDYESSTSSKSRNLSTSESASDNEHSEQIFVAEQFNFLEEEMFNPVLETSHEENTTMLNNVATQESVYSSHTTPVVACTEYLSDALAIPQVQNNYCNISRSLFHNRKSLFRSNRSQRSVGLTRSAISYRIRGRAKRHRRYNISTPISALRLKRISNAGFMSLSSRNHNRSLSQDKCYAHCDKSSRCPSTENAAFYRNLSSSDDEPIIYDAPRIHSVHNLPQSENLYTPTIPIFSPNRLIYHTRLSELSNPFRRCSEHVLVESVRSHRRNWSSSALYSKRRDVRSCDENYNIVQPRIISNHSKFTTSSQMLRACCASDSRLAEHYVEPLDVSSPTTIMPQDELFNKRFLNNHRLFADHVFSNVQCNELDSQFFITFPLLLKKIFNHCHRYYTDMKVMVIDSPATEKMLISNLDRMLQYFREICICPILMVTSEQFIQIRSFVDSKQLMVVMDLNAMYEGIVKCEKDIQKGKTNSIIVLKTLAQIFYKLFMMIRIFATYTVEVFQFVKQNCSEVNDISDQLLDLYQHQAILDLPDSVDRDNVNEDLRQLVALFDQCVISSKCLDDAIAMISFKPAFQMKDDRAAANLDYTRQAACERSEQENEAALRKYSVYLQSDCQSSQAHKITKHFLEVFKQIQLCEPNNEHSYPERDADSSDYNG